MEVFYRLFLIDDAPYSLIKYQRETVLDKDVEVTPWSDVEPRPPQRSFSSSSVYSGSNNSSNASVVSLGAVESLMQAASAGHLHEVFVRQRRIVFTHPIRNTLGVGPSSAHTTREQTLRRFGDCGMILENKTQVDGIPSSDCFHVQDQWIMEGVSEEGADDAVPTRVRLSVRFDTRFHRRVMFQNMIVKTIRSETKRWLDRYLIMVREALQDSDAIELAMSQVSAVTGQNGFHHADAASPARSVGTCASELHDSPLAADESSVRGGAASVESRPAHRTRLSPPLPSTQRLQMDIVVNTLQRIRRSMDFYGVVGVAFLVLVLSLVVLQWITLWAELFTIRNQLEAYASAYLELQHQQAMGSDRSSAVCFSTSDKKTTLWDV
jgi:VAD1 Analog of StAR-related lipid transfer domain